MARTPETGRKELRREGLVAGLGFAAADWVGAGVFRTPWQIALLILLSGWLAGWLVGVVASILRQRGLAVGLAVAGAVSLHGLSLISKDLSVVPSRARMMTTVGVLLLATCAGLVCGVGFAKRREHAHLRLLIEVCTIPAASLLWWFLPDDTAVLVSTCALPLVAAVGLRTLGSRLERRALVWILVGIVVVLAIPSWAGERGARRSEELSASVPARVGAPNIVLVIVDTLRSDHVDWDADAMRATGRLASEGVRFEQAISAASWTLPSVASLLTSLHPSQHGAVNYKSPLPADVETLAEVLHAAGYETAAFTGGAFVGPGFRLDQGFEVFDHEAEQRFRPFLVHTPLVWRLAKNRFFPQRWALKGIHEFGGVDELRSRVARWLEARDRSRPFFLLVHTYQVHDYYVYHPQTDGRVEGEGPSDVFRGRLTVDPSELEAATQEDLDWFHEIYRVRIDEVDLQLGFLASTIEEHVGSAGDLITVLTSDHGEGFDAELGRINHGGRLHDDLVRVPLVFHAPGRLPANEVVREQVRSVDVMPTILELAGVSAPPACAGRSLVSLARGEEDEAAEVPVAWSEDHLHESYRRALRLPDWKLIVGTAGEEIYHLRTDPREVGPLTEPVPADLRARWIEFEERYEMRKALEAELDAETLQRLRDLGYIR